MFLTLSSHLTNTVYDNVLYLPAAKKEKQKELKRETKAYEKLIEAEEECKQQLSSCEQRDVHARQVS